MEMHGRRSNYTLLSQIPDEPLLHQQPLQQSKFAASSGGAVAPQHLYYDSRSGEMNKFKSERAAAFDWDALDQRVTQPQHSRIITAAFPGSFELQRQSSESSFGESSISGDYHVPSLSNPDIAFGHLSDSGGESTTKAAEVSGSAGGGSSSLKNWVQQTEESYQLQLALALRLCSEATCADDPYLLDPVPDESAIASFLPASAEAISHRFWVTGCLSYFDRVPDGFYSIHGMDPYVWTVCSDIRESSRIPSLESLKTIDPAIVSSVEVISVDRRGDPSLKELQNIEFISCHQVASPQRKLLTILPS